MSNEVQSALEESIQRLQKHFGPKRVVVGKAASAKALAALDAKMGGLPEQLRALLALADGLSLDPLLMIDQHVMSVADIGRTVGGRRREGINPFTGAPMVFEPVKPHPHRVPVADDPTGDGVWVLRDLGTGDGAVVSMDHETEDAGGYELLGSSVASYLRTWSTHLTSVRARGGARTSVKGSVLTTAFAKKHDPGISALLADRRFAAVLKRGVSSKSMAS